MYRRLFCRTEGLQLRGKPAGTVSEKFWILLARIVMSDRNDNSQHINRRDTSSPEMRAKENNPSGVDAFLALALSTSRNENLTMLPSGG